MSGDTASRFRRALRDARTNDVNIDGNQAIAVESTTIGVRTLTKPIRAFYSRGSWKIDDITVAPNPVPSPG